MRMGHIYKGCTWDTFIKNAHGRYLCTASWCIGMGWLRSVGSIKLLVSFAEYRLFYRPLFFSKETCNLIDPTNQSHPIRQMCHVCILYKYVTCAVYINVLYVYYRGAVVYRYDKCDMCVLHVRVSRVHCMLMCHNCSIGKWHCAKVWQMCCMYVTNRCMYVTDRCVTPSLYMNVLQL